MEEFGRMLVKRSNNIGGPAVNYYIINIFKCISRLNQSYYKFRNVAEIHVTNIDLFTRDGAKEWCLINGFELIHYQNKEFFDL